LAVVLSLKDDLLGDVQALSGEREAVPPARLQRVQEKPLDQGTQLAAMLQDIKYVVIFTIFTDKPAPRVGALTRGGLRLACMPYVICKKRAVLETEACSRGKWPIELERITSGPDLRGNASTLRPAIEPSFLFPELEAP
jgi:hypothetical protein